MARAIFLAIFAIVLTVPPVLADIFRWDNFQLIRGTQGITPGPGVDLSSWNTPQRNLHFADFSRPFSRLDLTEANFSSSWLDHSQFLAAILTNANLSGTNLTGASLAHSTLTNGNLMGAMVTGANFADTTSRGFTKEQLYSTASYQQRNLRGIGLIANNLTGWDLSGQDLTDADFAASQLSSASLSGAVITGARFHRTTSGGFTKEQLYSTASYQQKNLRGLDLEGNDLTGWDFSGQDLTGALFYYSTLTNADLSGANLTYAQLYNGATLTNANLAGAIVTGAALYGTRSFTREHLYSTASYQQKNLRGIGLIANDLTGWDFSGQDLTGANFGSSTLTNANLSGANLTDARFGSSAHGEVAHVTLTNANFAGAIVAGANLYATASFTREHLYSTASYQQRNLRGILLGFNNLTGWDFSGQDLTGASFWYSRLTNADLSGANLTDAELSNGTITNANFAGAIVAGANFGRMSGFTSQQLYSTASYQQKNLRGIKLANNDLTGWDFSGQDLTGASFVGSQLTNANLSGANLTDARLGTWDPGQFTGATLTNANLAGAVVTGASFAGTTSRGFTKDQLYSTASYQQRNLRGIDLELNDLTGWDFSGQDLTGANFNSSRLTNADLSFADLRLATYDSLDGALVRNTIRRNGTIDGLNLAAGERLVAYAGVPLAVKITGDVSIAPTATFDVTDNAAILNNARTVTASAVREHIISGRGGSGPGGDWTGTGITSSTAAAANQAQPDSRSLGYANNGTLPLGAYTSFHGAAVDETSILIAYTRTGDANLDGVVNDDDVTIMGATYAPGVSNGSWALGDFDYNGFVDDDDVTLLGAFYDPSATPLITPMPTRASDVAAVPEPGSIALLTTMVGMLLAIRRFRYLWVSVPKGRSGEP